MTDTFIVLSNSELASEIARAMRSPTNHVVVVTSICDPRTDHELRRAALLITDLSDAAITDRLAMAGRHSDTRPAIVHLRGVSLQRSSRILPRKRDRSGDLHSVAESDGSATVSWTIEPGPEFVRRVADWCVEWLSVRATACVQPPPEDSPPVVILASDTAPQREYANLDRGDRLRSVRRDERGTNDIRRLLRAHERLVTNIAHDVRSPLMAIRESSQQLSGLSSEQVSPALQRSVDIIDRRTREIGRLVDNLLDGARLQAGKLHPHRLPISIADVAADIAAGLEPSFRQHRVNLSVEMPTGLPPVFCDEDMVGRILTNLLTNGLKFTPPGGSVCVSAERLAVTDLRISVNDTGAGMQPHELRRLFRRFTRGAGVQADGTGLGLSIVGELVRMHGGRVTVESVPNRGSSFQFSLPFFLPAALVRSFVRRSREPIAAFGVDSPPAVKFDAVHRYLTSQASPRDLVIPVLPNHRILWCLADRRQTHVTRVEQRLRQVLPDIRPFARVELPNVPQWLEGAVCDWPAELPARRVG